MPNQRKVMQRGIANTQTVWIDTRQRNIDAAWRRFRRRRGRSHSVDMDVSFSTLKNELLREDSDVCVELSKEKVQRFMATCGRVVRIV
jgi:hypothetical protein